MANVNDAPVGVPTISGTASKGQTLTANTGGISDADGLGTFSYQWLRGGVAIGGATGSTYLLVNADVGTQITVQVTYTDGHGTAEGPLTSAPTAVVTNVNDPPVGLPTISGTPTEDQTLTANTGGISDADGLGTFSYQWLRGGSTIGGATASTYTLGDADVGAQISVQVRYTDGGGTAEGPLTSHHGRTGGQRQRCAGRRADHQRHGEQGTDPDRRTPAASATPTAWAPSVTNGCAAAWRSAARRAARTSWSTPTSARRSRCR